MTDTERGLLDKISRWGPLWKRNVKLPITREEAELIQSRIPPAQDINEPWLPTC